VGLFILISFSGAAGCGLRAGIVPIAGFSRVSGTAILFILLMNFPAGLPTPRIVSNRLQWFWIVYTIHRNSPQFKQFEKNVPQVPVIQARFLPKPFGRLRATPAGRCRVAHNYEATGFKGTKNSLNV
jgi:hypothetical protein